MIIHNGYHIQYTEMLKWNKMNKNEYFTRKGVIKQIQYFLIDGPNESDPTKKSKLHCYGGKPFLRDVQKDSVCPDLPKGETLG